MSEEIKPRIVSAVGVAVGMNTGAPKTALAAALEKAMSEAVTKAHNEGVTDDEEMRQRIRAARDKVLEGE